jgi:hypothetical protein
LRTEQEWQARLQGKAAAYVSDKTQFMNVDPEKTDYLFGKYLQAAHVEVFIFACAYEQYDSLKIQGWNYIL